VLQVPEARPFVLLTSTSEFDLSLIRRDHKIAQTQMRRTGLAKGVSGSISDTEVYYTSL